MLTSENGNQENNNLDHVNQDISGALKNDNKQIDSSNSLDDFLDSFGGADESFTVHLYQHETRESGRVGEWKDAWNFGEFSELEILKRCRDEFGGGFFSLQIKNSKNQFKSTSKIFPVSGNGKAKSAEVETKQLQGIVDLIQENNKANRELIAAIFAKENEKPTLEQELEKFTKFQNLLGGSKKESFGLKDFVDMKNLFSELGIGEAGEEKPSDWLKNLVPILEPLLNKLVEKDKNLLELDLDEVEEEEETEEFSFLEMLERVNEYALIGSDPKKVAMLIKEEAGDSFASLVSFLLTEQWFGRICLMSPDSERFKDFYEVLRLKLLAIAKLEQKALINAGSTKSDNTEGSEGNKKKSGTDEKVNPSGKAGKSSKASRAKANAAP